MTTAGATIKVCTLCGASFACSPANCWCAALPPVMPVDMSGDCHCPQCLKRIIDERLAAGTDFVTPPQKQ